MANRIRTGDPRGFNKGRCSTFHVGSQVRQTPEEGWRTCRLKHWGNNNKDEVNSPKTLNDKNYQPLSQKFRQLKFTWFKMAFNLLMSITGYLWPSSSLKLFSVLEYWAVYSLMVLLTWLTLRAVSFAFYRIHVWICYFILFYH